MKLRLLIFNLLIICGLLFSQNKTNLDLHENTLQKANSVQLSGAVKLTSDISEITLINNGCFTIGTNNGMSAGKLDDNCQITYGHPYAMTSYPLFGVDGNWGKFNDIFSDPSSIQISNEGDTLSISAVGDNLAAEFKLISLNNGGNIKIVLSIENTSSETHQLGLGLTLDPALGKNGDGAVAINNSFSNMPFILSSNSLSSEIDIWEKSNGAKGIGIKMILDDPKPDAIIFDNWDKLYKNNSPDYLPGAAFNLYDICSQIFWLEQEVQAGSSITSEITLAITEPDFSTSVFIRWDIPNYLSIDGNIIFPETMVTYAEITNTGETSISNAELKISQSANLTPLSSTYPITISSGQTVFQEVKVKPEISYEDLVAPFTAAVLQSGNELDVFRRNIFIPETPVSDTGLVIVEDSLAVDNFPQIELFFGLENEETGTRILRLNSNNIFLFQDGERVNEFTIEKDNSGISTMADVVFVLDVSGSMGDNINDVRNNLSEFADSLTAGGFDYEIGIVTFSTTIDNVWDLTKDIDFLRQQLANINLWGGIENSPAALYRATELSFRPGSKRTIIWITDEPYPEDIYTKQQVVNRMLEMGITVHGVGLMELQTDWFNPIVLPTGGNFYDIFGNFRDILLDVARMDQSDRFRLSFNSIDENKNGTFTLEIHYAGLGVLKEYGYSAPNIAKEPKHLSYYPNPFNPRITLKVDKKDFTQGTLRIFNILGECIKTFSLLGNNSDQITWNAKNETGNLIGSGFYIVQLTLNDNTGNKVIESAKILYLK